MTQVKYSGAFPDLIVNCRNYINKVAKDLAYAKGTSSKTYNYKTGKAKASFTTAIKKVYGSVYSKWSKQCRLGASCDVFVGTVVRYSGCDTSYPRGLDGQVKTTPKHCVEVKDIKAGDIMRYGTKTGGHTRMIVDIGGVLYNCEANHDYKGGQYGHIGSKATAKPSTAVKNLKIFRCNSAFKAMSKGDIGSEVTKLQKFLNWAGFDCGTVDGDFGDKTVNAVKAFQTKVGLTVDGEFGSKSLAKAKEYTTEVQPTKKPYSGTFPKLPVRRYFKRGDKGVQVKYLQQFLNWYGKYGLVVDGVIGSKTIVAVEKFQKSEKLGVDGLFGKKCLAKAKQVKI